MVILEAVAVTAGSVAAYKGGKAAVVAPAKSGKNNMKLSSQEKERKETYNLQKEEQKERFSKINEYRSSLRDMNGTLVGNKRRGGATPMLSFNRRTLGNKDKDDMTTSSWLRGVLLLSLSAAGLYSARYSKDGSQKQQTVCEYHLTFILLSHNL